MLKREYNSKNQSGIVSIMVVGIIAVLLTLIVLAFSRISNRDLRQSLDRQLSSQAAYAAETGLNDAYHKIASAGLPNDRNTCNDGNTFVYGTGGGSPVGSATSGAAVTCILIKSQLDNVRVDNQAAGSTKVFVITNAYELNDLQFSWGGGAVTAATPYRFPTAASWPSAATPQTAGTKPAVLRVSVSAAYNGSGWNTRDNIIGHSRTYFLFPNATAAIGTNGTADWSNPSTSGAIIPGNCNDRSADGTHQIGQHIIAYPCNSLISRLPGGTGAGSTGPFSNTVDNGAVYYVSVRSVYNEASYVITGTHNGATSSTIRGPQALIDVTAKGTDVLKRIQARINTSPSCASSPTLGDALCPSYVIDSATSICKLLLIPQDGTAAQLADSECTL